jgi:hypothetical protein
MEPLRREIGKMIGAAVTIVLPSHHGIERLVWSTSVMGLAVMACGRAGRRHRRSPAVCRAASSPIHEVSS